MKSKVYFSSMRASIKRNTLDRILGLVNSAGIDSKISKNDLVAIKIHFGEKGNTSYVRPVLVRPVVDRIRELGGKPFLTDANTLYVGTRGNACDHLTTALQNGFDYTVVNAPLIIADGLRGSTKNTVKVGLKHADEVHIGAEVVNSDAIISIAHFKCHELTGFGGAIKNLGMGSACREGKLFMHSTVAPYVAGDTCISCGVCIMHCAAGAISIPDDNAAAHVAPEKCVGCGECILVCQNSSIKIRWNEAIPTVQEKIVEYTYGVLKGKENKSLFINFITQVSPACDCYGYNDAPIVPDIGIAVSDDPVALDQACADLVNAAVGFRDTALQSGYGKGEDKFKGVYDYIDWEIQLKYAQKIGLGSTGYELVEI